MTFNLADASFIQKGTGKDLVFMHGYLSQKESFYHQIEYFSKFYKVTAFDFLGQGKSSPLQEPFSVADYADWTKALFQALRIENPYILAHSFGARVAIKMAAQGGQLCDKLLLTGAAGVVLKRGIKYKIKVKAYRFCKKIAPNFAEKRFGSAEYRTLSPIMRESYKKIVNEDLRKDAAKIETPVLLVCGEDDTTTPIKEAQAYLAVLKRGKLQTITGGHFAFLENPLPFNLIAEEFFSNE